MKNRIILCWFCLILITTLFTPRNSDAVILISNGPGQALVKCAGFKLRLTQYSVTSVSFDPFEDDYVSISRPGSNVFVSIQRLGGGGSAVENIEDLTTQDLKDLCSFASEALDQAGPLDGRLEKQQLLTVIFEASTRISDGAYGDLDGDGNPDIVVANEDDDDVSVGLGDSGGMFGAQTRFPVGDRPVAIALGRFNADDHLDIVTANEGFGSGNVTILFGDGNGGFAPAQSVAAGSSPFDIVAVDVDKNGTLDLAVADLSNQALLLLGNGDGTFQQAQPIGSAFPRSITSFDLDNDTFPDLITNSHVLMNNGSGGFPAEAQLSNGFQPNLTQLRDLNNDALLDLITTSIVANSVTVQLGNGDGTFQSARTYTTGNSPTGVIVTDLDADNDVDLVVSNFDSDHLSLLYNFGDGTFNGNEVFTSASSANQSTENAAVADFDNDGLFDVVTANDLGNQDAAILRGIANNRLDVPIILSGQDGSRVTTADFDNDGNMDVAFTLRGTITGAPNDRLQIRLGNGDLTFQNATTIDLPDDDFPANFTLARHVDGDGNIDLLVGNSGTNNVSVFLGNGNGTFQSGITTAVGIIPEWLATGDLDNNGTLDVVVANAGDLGAANGSVSVLLGDGTGGFSAGAELFLNTEPDAVTLGDYNSDGQLDLAAIIQDPTFDWNIHVAFGDGQGGFEVPVVIDSDLDLTDNLTTTDLDLDGNPDLLATLGSSEIGLLRGRGDGTFENLIQIDAGGAVDITVTDLNQDLMPDLLAPQDRGGSVAVLVNGIPQPDANILVLEDTNGNAVDDVAGLRVRNDGVIRTRVSDGQSGATLQDLTFFNPDWNALGYLNIPGVGMGGEPGLGVVATRNEDGLLGIQIKNPASGVPLGTLFPWSANWRYVDADVVVDPSTNFAKMNGPHWVATLAERKSDGLPGIELRDPATGLRQSLIYPLGFGWTPLALDVLNINGSPALASLHTRDTDGLAIVQVRDAATGALVRNVFPLGLGWSPLELKVVPDISGNNADEVAVRMTRDIDGLEIIQIRDGLTQTLISNVYPIGAGLSTWKTRQFEVLMSNGIVALGILSTRTSDGQVLVQMRNAQTAGVMNNVFFIPGPWQYQNSFQVMANQDGGDDDELAVLMRNGDDGTRIVQIRDSETDAVIRNVFQPL